LFGVSSGEFTRSLFSLTLLLSCVYGILIAALSSLLVTYVSATWTLAYRSFAGQAAPPAIPPSDDADVAA
jgi:hypothetical protein